MCGWMGMVGYWFAARARRQTLAHLKQAYGREKSESEIRQLARDVFRMIGKNAADIIRAFKIYDFPRFQKIRIAQGFEHAERAHARGKGVIFLTAHFGAFEFVATELSFRGYKPLIIGSRLKDERLNELLWEQRNKVGAVAIERGKETMRLMRALKGGDSIAILIDQDTRVKSVYVDFFGKSCSTPIGAALFASKTGAAVVPIFFHLRPDGMQEVNCYPEVEMIQTGSEENDLVVNTQKLTAVIEAEIRKHPSQWLWMHRRWKTRPPEEARLK